MSRRVAVLASVPVLAGCGDGEPAPQVDPPSDAQDPDGRLEAADAELRASAGRAVTGPVARG